MKQGTLFTKTRNVAPKDEVTQNAKLLVRAGYVYKEMAGVYSYLPLGYRVLTKIKNIIRNEMNAVGGQEVLLTTLQDSTAWEKTDRWDDTNVTDWFKTRLKNNTELGLAFTHEEPLTKLLKDHISSYRDLPIFVYQIQTKFRNELRAKSGIMRGREFPMKDMYSFTENSQKTDTFHEKVKKAYRNIFKKVGIGNETFLTISRGGTFSEYSHEFQTLSEAGEDTIMLSREKNIAINKNDCTSKLLKDFDLEQLQFEEKKSIEVGDIYKLGTKYSKSLGLTYTNKQGKSVYVDMGSYGIGVSRLMGTIVELHSSNKGMLWPKEVSPFHAHILVLRAERNKHIQAESVYNQLTEQGVEILLDDRHESPGVTLKDSDLLGIPLCIIIGNNTKEDTLEIHDRAKNKIKIISAKNVIKYIRDYYAA